MQPLNWIWEKRQSETHTHQQFPYPCVCVHPAVLLLIRLPLLLKVGMNSAHLFVHEGVDQWVVHTWALGEKSRDGDKSIIFVLIWRVGKVESGEGVRPIASDKGAHHHHDHPRDLLLCLLRGGGLCLLGSNLNPGNIVSAVIDWWFIDLLIDQTIKLTALRAPSNWE